MDIRFSFSRFLLFALGLWVLGACTPVTPTFPVVTQEPGAPLIVESPYPPPVTNTPEAYPPPGGGPMTATPEYFQPPPCQFPGGTGSNISGPNLTDYTISAPQTISMVHGLIDIIQWIPATQKLLLYTGDGAWGLIETYNVASGEIQTYAGGLENPWWIIWVDSEQAIAYFDTKTVIRSGVAQQALWISYGNPQDTQLLWNNANPYDMQTNIPALPGELNQIFRPSLVYSPELWKYPSKDSGYDWAKVEFSLVSRNDNSMVAFYGPPWLFLLDTQTNQPCEINLGKAPNRALEAKWNADGRFLALITTSNRGGELISFSHLAVLDTISGNLFQSVEIGAVTAIEWLDNRNLFVLGHNQSGMPDKLFVFDTASNLLQPVLPEHDFYSEIYSRDLSLSSDRNTLATRCYDNYASLCLISISATP